MMASPDARNSNSVSGTIFGGRSLAALLKIVLIGMSGAASVTGLISLIEHKERSGLVFVSMALTLWVGLVGSFLI
jgi:hypothetical protein